MQLLTPADWHRRFLDRVIVLEGQTGSSSSSNIVEAVVGCYFYEVLAIRCGAIGSGLRAQTGQGTQRLLGTTAQLTAG